MSCEPLYTTKPRGQDSEQRVYRFPNGFGASVVCHEYSYGGDKGLYELGVIRFTGPRSGEWKLTYETPITSDVIGWLDQSQVDSLLEQIAALPG